MPDTSPTESGPTDGPAAETGWDSSEVMRERTAETRQQRDQAISELRDSKDDEQILDEFGIDLGEIER